MIKMDFFFLKGSRLLLTRWLWHAWRNVSVKKRGSEIERQKKEEKIPSSPTASKKQPSFHVCVVNFVGLAEKLSPQSV